MTSQESADVMLAEHRLNMIALARIAEIDAMFDMATGWGSWMVMCANEREDLVNAINARSGYQIPHKNQARCGGLRTN
jgi:hypothetical protein